MIKILTPGDRNREVSCKRCNARLEFEPEDVVCINTAVGYAGETWEPRFIIECPECGEDIYLDHVISEKTRRSAEKRLKDRNKKR